MGRVAVAVCRACGATDALTTFEDEVRAEAADLAAAESSAAAVKSKREAEILLVNPLERVAGTHPVGGQGGGWREVGDGMAVAEATCDGVDDELGLQNIRPSGMDGTVSGTRCWLQSWAWVPSTT